MTILRSDNQQLNGVEHGTRTAGCIFKKGILAGSDMEEASRSFKAISHPLRLKILCVLGLTEMSVLDILGVVGTTQSNVSQHLCLLKDKGIVKSRKDANRVFYSIKSQTVLKILGNTEVVIQ